MAQPRRGHGDLAARILRLYKRGTFDQPQAVAAFGVGAPAACRRLEAAGLLRRVPGVERRDVRWEIVPPQPCEKR